MGGIAWFWFWLLERGGLSAAGTVGNNTVGEDWAVF